jgi:hypothetical protein
MFALGMTQLVLGSYAVSGPMKKPVFTTFLSGLFQVRGQQLRPFTITNALVSLASTVQVALSIAWFLPTLYIVCTKDAASAIRSQHVQVK